MTVLVPHHPTRVTRAVSSATVGGMTEHSAPTAKHLLGLGIAIVGGLVVGAVLVVLAVALAVFVVVKSI